MQLGQRIALIMHVRGSRIPDEDALEAPCCVKDLRMQEMGSPTPDREVRMPPGRKIIGAIRLLFFGGELGVRIDYPVLHVVMPHKLLSQSRALLGPCPLPERYGMAHRQDGFHPVLLGFSPTLPLPRWPPCGSMRKRTQQRVGIGKCPYPVRGGVRVCEDTKQARVVQWCIVFVLGEVLWETLRQPPLPLCVFHPLVPVFGNLPLQYEH